MAGKQSAAAEISVLEIKQGEIEFCVLGQSPLIYNAVSQKAKRELLYPKGRKTAADKAGSLKHDPLAEYRNSVYRMLGDKPKSRLYFPAIGFKASMATAALDLPGVAKSQIGRLVYVVGEKIEVYGVPKLFMAITRSADMNRTPDVRTRAILPEWACRVRVRFVKPIIREQVIINLLAAAGVTVGVGDFRQEKGKGSYGQFALVSESDADFKRIVAQGACKAQDEALLEPEYHDAETEELFKWFGEERIVREGAAKADVPAKRARKANGTDHAATVN